MIMLGLTCVILVYFLYLYISMLRDALNKAEDELVRVKSDRNILKARVELYERGRKGGDYEF